MHASTAFMTPLHCAFNFFYPFVQICKISGNTFSIFDKNQDPSTLRVQKSNRMKYHCCTKWVSCHLAIIRHETNMTLKISLVSPISTVSPRLTSACHLSIGKHNKIAIQCPLITCAKFIPTGINATYDLISPPTVQLFNNTGSRSVRSIHVSECAQKS